MNSDQSARSSAGTPALVHVYSYPRSGSNYLMALLGRNLYPHIDLHTSGQWGHWSNRKHIEAPFGKLFGHHGTPYTTTPGPSVYIYRDGRAVLWSLYRSPGFHRRGIKLPSFSKWITHPMDWRMSPSNASRNAGSPPYEWYSHVRLWEPAIKSGSVFGVRYESLIKDPEGTVSQIAKWARSIGYEIDYPPSDTRPFDPVVERVGPDPHATAHDSWREHWSDEDLAYFYQIVPHGSSFITSERADEMSEKVRSVKWPVGQD